MASNEPGTELQPTAQRQILSELGAIRREIDVLTSQVRIEHQQAILELAETLASLRSEVAEVLELRREAQEWVRGELRTDISEAEFDYQRYREALYESFPAPMAAQFEWISMLTRQDRADLRSRVTKLDCLVAELYGTLRYVAGSTAAVLRSLDLASEPVESEARPQGPVGPSN